MTVKSDRFKKPWTCDLCGKTDDDVEMYCGGYAMFAHPKCGEIGNKTIELHLRRIAFHLHPYCFLLMSFIEFMKKSMEMNIN